jgi:hypothetical protein
MLTKLPASAFGFSAVAVAFAYAIAQERRAAFCSAFGKIVEGIMDVFGGDLAALPFQRLAGGGHYRDVALLDTKLLLPLDESRLRFEPGNLIAVCEFLDLAAHRCLFVNKRQRGFELGDARLGVVVLCDLLGDLLVDGCDLCSLLLRLRCHRGMRPPDLALRGIRRRIEIAQIAARFHAGA